MGFHAWGTRIQCVGANRVSIVPERFLAYGGCGGEEIVTFRVLPSVSPPYAWAHGAGEIIVTSVDREGTGLGYDTELVRSMARAVSVPVIAHGGAGKIPDLADAVGAGASAVAAGSLFVFHGPHRAVLITYPNRSVITSLSDPNTGTKPAS